MLHLPVGINALDTIHSRGFANTDETESVSQSAFTPGARILSRSLRLDKSLLLETSKFSAS
ncbi:hypothetical protein [Desulfonatronum thiodismutans]|uniref:hypothetical protein n=1 Tax=Desulfonatronum thiodismutans TaxID=159290 RepID=UPI0004ABDB0C|nr:hypothetical protein [Desulfonatronum thiodismutans]